MEPIFVTCFCHNSCCLSYRVSSEFVFLKTVPQHIGHAMSADINILHGSVAPLLSSGGICNDVFIANFLLSVTVKNIENRSLFGEAMDKSLVSCFLLDQDV